VNLHDYWGLLGSALVLTTVIMAIVPLKKNDLKRRLTAGALVLVMLLPIRGELSAAGYLRGVAGDLSATTVMLTLFYLIGFEAFKNNARELFLGILLFCGLVLYPFSLGPFHIDPYQWGYQPLWMLISIGLAGFFILYRQPSMVCYLAFPLAAFALRLSGSNNLWDYLLDPLIFGYALVNVFRRLLRQLRQSED
jgi:hypothetical protein